MGAARSGQIKQAEAELARVASDLQNHDDVWARNTGEVLRREAAAWLALANGDEDGAETLMRSAAELEDETDKSGLSPGRVLPAHEPLADMLMEVGCPQEALAEYQTSLTHATRRYNSFIGAARAAVAAEQNDVARSYYEKFLQLAASDSVRADLDEARGFSWRWRRRRSGRDGRAKLRRSIASQVGRCSAAHIRTDGVSCRTPATSIGAWAGTGEHSWDKLTSPDPCNPLISFSFNGMYQIGG